MNRHRFEEKEVQLADLKVLRSLWPFIRPYLWMILLSTLLVFLVTLVELAIPQLIQIAFDGFIVPDQSNPAIHFLWFEFNSFKYFALFFLSIILTGFLIDFFQAMFMEYTGQKIILNLRVILFSHITRLPVPFFDKNTSGWLVSRVTGDIENMNEMFTSIMIFIFKDILLMVGILVILCSVDPGLAAIMSLLVPVIFISIVFFSKLSRKAFRNIRKKIAAINHSFSEMLNGIKILHITSSQTSFSKQFTKLNHAHYRAALFQIRIFAVFMPFIGFLGVLSIALIIWFGSLKVWHQQITIGGLVAFLTYMRLFFRPLRELSEKFNLLQNALASAERITDILDMAPVQTRTKNKTPRMQSLETLDFDCVDFSYDPGKPVLKKVSFHLPRGSAIGIAGRTGAGKSSIINLVTGFYSPDAGRICYNGQDQISLDIADIRKHIALVMQDPILFSGTIRENILPPGIPKDDEALTSALLDANCDFLFDKFQGLETNITENGQPLSSGEKQLICIARAFCFNPDLIIFDEATSYMDTQSEQKVHDAMNRLMKGRLAIIIAHRLSTIRHCGQILLLQDGTVVEHGTHEQLTHLEGQYFHLLEKEKI